MPTISRGSTDELVIVLDDFHLIQEPSIHALLSLLVRRLPPTIQLVIASREEPPLPVALLRGRRELAEVRADDLRFDRAEAIAFVREMSERAARPPASSPMPSIGRRAGPSGCAC